MDTIDIVLGQLRPHTSEAEWLQAKMELAYLSYFLLVPAPEYTTSMEHHADACCQLDKIVQSPCITVLTAQRKEPYGIV